MPFAGDSGGYGYPYSDAIGPDGDPNRTQRATPVLTRIQSTGEFKATLSFAPRVEAGNTVRFTAIFEHVKDGLITTWASSPAVAIKDANGNTVGGGATGVTMPNAVAQDPASSGNYYIQVEFGASIQPGNYTVVWTGTYTPVGQTQALTVAFRQQFSVEVTNSKSAYWIRNTSSF